MSILCSGYSRQCIDRIHVNQDKYGSIRMLDLTHKEITLAVVADGISLGYEGKYASYNTVLWLLNWAAKYFSSNRFDPGYAATEIQKQMAKYNHMLNDFSEQHSDKDTCCTVCGLITDGSQMLVFNAGDSRLYELSGTGDVRCMTKDDKAEDGYSIAMHIGGKNDSEIKLAFSTEEFHMGSRYVLCTDGFYKRTRFPEIGRKLFNAHNREDIVKVIDDYSEKIIQSGETDDITALIVMGSE